jgi:hypothetical protein
VKRLMLMLAALLACSQSARAYVMFLEYVSAGSTIYQGKPPYLYLSISHMHPKILHPADIHVAESWISPTGYEINHKTRDLLTIEIVAAFPGMGYVSDTIMFKGDATKASFTFGETPITVSLINDEGQPDKSRPAVLEFESPRFGRIRYSARVDVPDGFGKFLEWKHPDGSVTTPESRDYTRLNNPDGSLRQLRMSGALVNVVDLGETGLEWHLYGEEDLLEERDEKGFFQIRENAVPIRSTVFRFPGKSPPHDSLRVIYRDKGRTRRIQDMGIKSLSFQQHFSSSYPASRFAELDPEGNPEAPPPPSDPFAWSAPVRDAPEIGDRYFRTHKRDYFQDLWNRVSGEEQVKPEAVYYHSDPADPSSFGKEHVRIWRSDSPRWQVLRYDEAGRLCAEYRSLPGAGSAMPPLDEKALREVSELVLVHYPLQEANTPKTDNPPFELTHLIGGRFVSRHWVHFTTDSEGIETIHLKRSENPDANSTDTSVHAEDRQSFWPGFF